MKLTLLLPIVLLTAALPPPAHAQEGWLVPFAVAYQPELGGFRDAFRDHGLPLPAERQYGWGIELRSLLSGFLVGPMYLRTWADAETDSWQLRTEADALFGEIGFKLAPAGWLSIVPMVGVGGLSQSLHLRSRAGDLPLDSLLLNPGREVGIKTGLKLAGLASLELGVAVPTNAGSFGISARVGYLYSPLAPGWHTTSGSRLTDAPAAGLRGPFLSIGLLLLPAAELTTTTR
ncbi:MAG: hypothetical protein R6X14_09235 [bacterium]